MFGEFRVRPRHVRKSNPRMSCKRFCTNASISCSFASNPRPSAASRSSLILSSFSRFPNSLNNAAELCPSAIARAMMLAIAGVVLGTVGALLLTRFLSGMPYGVGVNDPTTLLSVATLLIGVTALASATSLRDVRRELIRW